MTVFIRFKTVACDCNLQILYIVFLSLSIIFISDALMYAQTVSDKASDMYQGAKEGAGNAVQQTKETLGMAGDKAQHVSSTLFTANVSAWTGTVLNAQYN